LPYSSSADGRMDEHTWAISRVASQLKMQCTFF
jgi:hypothetical protein